ncbi:glycoside hydrolase family 5 protein [Aquimarina sp. ERC-38]|uniref:cellulase family glycosylhydrolase n=1 Tax=Aquimarina sp. ERC-38 TaxID=2949996 RepID=UPI0022455AF9|nr:cellulase family glycosylhydrolase [Aquimarina sp. ERC-38]UZO82263.1 glycoside hydrolase family 5 protein [Aquimarina sp. ERC-38]
MKYKPKSGQHYLGMYTLVLESYFTTKARQKLKKYLKDTVDVTINSSTLRHELDANFFSEDGQIVAFTDRNVLEVQEIIPKKNNPLYSKTNSNYQVIMLKEDGFWRIRHLTRTQLNFDKTRILKKSPLVNDTIILVDNQPFPIKGINYYPKDTPWDLFGDKFNAEVVDQDFHLIKNAGLNTIRIFIPYTDFGKEYVLPEKLEKLRLVMNTAEKVNLKVIVTLFDFYGNYALEDWTFTHRHLEQIVDYLKDHKALLAWDLKNEPDLDFDSRGKSRVTSWLTELVAQTKEIDSIHPITIGWSSPEAAKLLQDQVDFLSFHYYGEISDFKERYKPLKAFQKPVVLQEFGLSSYRGLWAPFGNSEEDQALYYQNFQNILKKESVHFLSWTLYDFTNVPKGVVGSLPWRRAIQKHFGFIRTNGEKKPAFQFISN